MSFYGNSYHYTAESFARIILLNSGINKYIVDTPEDFSEVGTTPVHLDALQRDSGIGIRAGNHWIKLVYNKDKSTFQILHNSPGGPTTMIVPFGIGTETQSELVPEENKLKFNDVLKVPTISYDNNGHIASIQEALFYQLPPDPAIQLESRMNSIDGKDDLETGKTDTSLRRILLDRMHTLDGRDDEGNNNPEDTTSLAAQLKSSISSIGDWEGRISASENVANKAFSTASEANSAVTKLDLTIEGIISRLTAIATKLGIK